MVNYFEHYKKSEVTNTRRVINTPSDIAQKTFFYVQEIGYLKSLKPHLGKRSQLNSYLFLVVLSGGGTVTYKNIQYSLRAQDCFLLDCQEEYSHISQANNPWELLWVHFNGPMAEEYYKYIIKKNGFRFQSIFLPTIIDAINQLMEIHSSITEHCELISSQLITTILTQSVTGSNQKTSELSDTKTKLNQVLSYLDQHFAESISLDTISKLFFISKYHLSREFKKEFNQTIIQCILNKRITYSKELLRFTDLSIGEIARECGIGDINYFNKIFKRFEKMTASEYRRRW